MPKIADAATQTPSESLLGSIPVQGMSYYVNADSGMDITSTLQSVGCSKLQAAIKEMQRSAKKELRKEKKPAMPAKTPLAKTKGAWKSPSAEFPDRSTLTLVGAGVWQDPMTGKKYVKKLYGWAPYHAERARAARNARYFSAKVKSDIHWPYSPSKKTKITTGKDGWISATLQTPSGALVLMLKQENGKDIYKLVRNSATDFTSEQIVVGEVDSKVKMKKPKTLKAELSVLKDKAKRLLALFDAFESNTFLPSGKRKLDYNSETERMIELGVFKKGVPIHCSCGKHKVNFWDDEKVSCKDFYDAMNELRGIIEL